MAVVLPPREAFSAQGAGAISLLVARLVAAPGSHDVRVFGVPVAEPFAGVRFVPIRPALWPGTQAIRYALAVHRALRAEPAELVEVHNRPDMALFLARRHHRVCLILHNDPRGMRGARTARQRLTLAHRLAGVVAVSAWLRGRFGEAASVLPNCIDLRTIPLSPGLRERTLLFAGRIVADKGADSFAAACALALPLLPGWRAEMIGADRFGPDSPDTPFLRRLRPAAAASGVRLHGWQPHDAVLAAMARAAVVVVPSRWPEPFGLTALEAMACGAALLYAPRGGLPEVAGGIGVSVNPDDVPALAAAMVALALDPDRQAALGQAGRDRASQFGVPAMAARLDAIRYATLSA